MARLKQWCADASAASGVEGGQAYRFVYVDQKTQRTGELHSTFFEFYSVSNPLRNPSLSLFAFSSPCLRPIIASHDDPHRYRA